MIAHEVNKMEMNIYVNETVIVRFQTVGTVKVELKLGHSFVPEHSWNTHFVLFAFQPLSLTGKRPAQLVLSYTLHGMQIFPRLVYVPVNRYMFSGAWHRCIFSRAWHRRIFSRAWHRCIYISRAWHRWMFSLT